MVVRRRAGLRTKRLPALRAVCAPGRGQRQLQVSSPAHRDPGMTGCGAEQVWLPADTRRAGSWHFFPVWVQAVPASAPPIGHARATVIQPSL